MSDRAYSDAAVTLIQGDGRAALASMRDRAVDLVITDPPYDERTHTMARTSSTLATAGGRALSGSQAKFTAWTLADQYDVFAQLGRVTRAWVIASVPFSVAAAFDQEPPQGLRCLRVGSWIKTNPAPMLSADRPAMGWETFVCLHRDDVKPAWNNGGRAMNYVGPTAQGTGHPTAKPLPMIRQWVKAFSAPGDLILDPFAGSGTTLLAARAEERQAIAYENDAVSVQIARGRLGGVPTFHPKDDQDSLFGQIGA